MPRYFFDLRDGDHLVVDDEGMMLADIEAAKAEATQSLADIAEDDGQRIAIEVRDEAGPVLQLRSSRLQAVAEQFAPHDAVSSEASGSGLITIGVRTARTRSA